VQVNIKNLIDDGQCYSMLSTSTSHST
jgi:hypothetical protein